MRSRLILIALVLGVGALLPETNVSVVASSGNEKVAMVDDCDPNADWGVNGCLNNDDGTVSRAEFTLFLTTPLAPPGAVGHVGHPSWRNDPGYLTVEEGEKIKVKNRGGRNHTFTKVAQFGGGTPPPLRVGLTLAPECPAAVLVGPGGKVEVNQTDLALGDNRFMCCFHSWMRTVIKVVPDEGHGDKHKR